MNKTINFNGVDNGVSSMFERLRRDSTALSKDMIRDTLRNTATGRDQVKVIEEQISAMKRRNEVEFQGQKINADQRLNKGMQSSSAMDRDKAQKEYKTTMADLNNANGQDNLQTKLLQEVVATIKETAAQEIRENKEGVKKNIEENKATWFGKLKGQKDFDGAHLSEEDKLKLRLQSQMLEDEKPKKKESVFGALVAAELLKQIGGIIGQIPNVKNENELVKPMVSLAGTAAGGLMGSAADLVTGAKIFGNGAGQTNMGVIGAQLGKYAGDAAGDAIARSLGAQDDYFGGIFKMNALTGKDMNDGGYGGRSLTKYGVSSTQALGTAESIARNRGLRGTGNDTENLVALSKNFGLDQNTLLGVSGNQRFTQNTDLFKEISKIFGASSKNGLFKGGDTTIFAEILANQTSLVKEFSNTAEKVNSDVATRMITGFDKLGGGFSASDPRSLARITGINSDLSGAGNDFVQAQNYSVLRRNNPKASLFDLKNMESKGLQTPEFLNGVISDIDKRGGSEDEKKLALKYRLPSLSYDAVNRLYKNRGKLRGMDQAGVNGILTEDGVRAGAESKTTSTSVSSAKIEDAFVEGAISGVKKVGEMFGNAINKAIKNVSKDLENTVHVGK